MLIDPEESPASSPEKQAKKEDQQGHKVNGRFRRIYALWRSNFGHESSFTSEHTVSLQAT